jgi:hypothetical protein
MQGTYEDIKIVNNLNKNIFLTFFSCFPTKLERIEQRTIKNKVFYAIISSFKFQSDTRREYARWLINPLDL